MRLQAIELFTDIGFGGKQDRLLMQAVGIETSASLQQRGNLFGQPLFDGIGLTSRRRIRTLPLPMIAD